MFGKSIAIDLGTANTRIFVVGDGMVLNRPTVIAFDLITKKVIATGDEALVMLGRTPDFLEVHQPVSDGAIVDIEMAEKLLAEYLRTVLVKSLVVRPRVAVGVPFGVTDVEKRAVRDTLRETGIREIVMVQQPLAAAVGAGLPINEPQGCMVVDIGAGTTEVAVLSLGDIVSNKTIRIAGNKLNKAIIAEIRRFFNVLISHSMAEDLKINIGAATEDEKEESMEVTGRDLYEGIPKTITVTTKHIRIAIEEPLQKIILAISETLEDTPPELSGDIIDAGITLTGGGAQLYGLAHLISSATNLSVTLAEDPTNCIVTGMSKILANPGKYNKVLAAVNK